MAASARTQQLREQRLRSAVLYKIARSSRRILPLSNFSARLADSAQDAIDEDMDRRYDDGLVSSDEYITHLKDRLTRGTLTELEKVRVRDSIRDVGQKADLEILESAYKQTAEGTPEKAAAAQTISSYYENVIGSLTPGTPAHSNALANKSIWAQESSDQTVKIEKTKRVALRYRELARVSALDSKDPNTAQEKATVYTRLANEALADGEENEANRYQALANTEVENARELTTRQTKSTIISYMNENLDKYSDKSIGPYQMLEALNEAEKAADEAGDFALSVRVNNLRERIEKDIERAGKAGSVSFKKKALEMLDTIEMDIANLETAFKYGEPFTPQSEYFKQFVKGSGVPDIEDLVTLKALGFSAAADVVDQMEEAGIDVPEGRRSKIQEELTASSKNREAFTGGRLLAAIDPGTGEVTLEDIDSPEEAAKYYTDPDTGLSFSLIDKNKGENAATPEERILAVQRGFASPSFFAQSQNLLAAPEGTQAPYEIVRQKKFFGIDPLARDKPIDANIPLYNTDESDKGIYAVRAKDLGESEDPNVFYKVETTARKTKAGTINRLTITGEAITPKYDIDPVIVVPYTDETGQRGLDRVYIKRNQTSGEIDSYYSERRGRALQKEELGSILRGKAPVAAQPEVAPGGGEPSIGGFATAAKVEGAVTPTPEPGPAPPVLPRSGVSTPSFRLLPTLTVPRGERLRLPGPSASDIAGGAELRGTMFDQPQKIGLGLTIKPSTILSPRTTGEKFASGLIFGGAAIQKKLQKIPTIGKFF